MEGANIYTDKISKGVVTDKSGTFELHSRDAFKENDSTQSFSTCIKYTRLALMEAGIFSFGSVLINDKIYVIGGDGSILTNEAMKAFDSASFGNNQGSNFLLNLRKDLS